MSSITLFYNNFTLEEELKKDLVTATGYTLLTDRDLLDMLASRFNMEQNRAERAVFGPGSVFNAFTLEKERTLSKLKLVVAEQIMADKVIICGLAALLVSPDIGHILRVGVFDTKAGRMQRAIAAGIAEKKAAKMIAAHDKKAGDFIALLDLDSIHNPSLYDLRINADALSIREIEQTILEQYRRPAVLPDESSKAPPLTLPPLPTGSAIWSVRLTAAGRSALLPARIWPSPSCPTRNLPRRQRCCWLMMKRSLCRPFPNA